MATKSSKKPVRKTNTSAKKTSSSRTAAAKATKKVVAAKAVKTTAKADGTSRGVKRMRIFHAVIGLLHAVQGAIILWQANNFSVPVTTSFLTADSLAEGRPLVSASRQLFDVRVAWLVASFMFVAALAHLSVATVFSKRYQRILGNGVNLWRWLVWVLTAGLILIIVALLAGVRDAAALALLFVVGEGLHVTGYQLESGSKAYPHLPWRLALKFTVTIAVVLAWTVYAANHYGGSSLPNYVYWLLAVSAVYFGLFTYVAYSYFKKRGQLADFTTVEKTYAAIDLAAKSSIAWIIFAAVLK